MEQAKVIFKAKNSMLSREFIGLALRAWEAELDDKNLIYLYDGEAVDELLLNQCDLVIATNEYNFSKPILVINDAEYITDGSVLHISKGGRIRVVFNPKSTNNALFVTDACNNYCVMCPQPPKPVINDNINHLLQIIQNIRIVDEPRTIGITGGEPTLLGENLVKLVQSITEKFENTIIQLLSNGRLFSYSDFAYEIKNAAKGRIFVGIPFFGVTAEDHNYVVQSKNAFQQTIAGIYECRRHEIDVEIRVVLTKDTVFYLDLISEFILRNFPFACHIALMGMENMGFAKLNYSDVWVSPDEYTSILKRNVQKLDTLGMNVSIFNLPYCLVDKEIWSHVRDSISDYKQTYYQQCNDCLLSDKCGGVFSSCSDKFPLSKNIKAIDSIENTIFDN